MGRKQIVLKNTSTIPSKTDNEKYRRFKFTSRSRSMERTYIQDKKFEKEDILDSELAIADYENCIFNNCDLSNANLSLRVFFGL